MARKDSYKIPQRLNSTYWDIEISPSKDGSVPPISMKLIAGVFISFAFCLLMLMESYMQYASTGTKVLFVIAWIIVTVVVLTRDKSKTFRFELVQPLIEYLPKRRRVVWTRKSASAAGFYDIAGIKKIDHDGIISYDDGTSLGISRLHEFNPTSTAAIATAHVIVFFFFMSFFNIILVIWCFII